MPRPSEAAPALLYKEGENIVLDGETYEDPLVAVRSKTVELTDAQIKALPTTAVEIVPAPGAGKRIAVIKGWCDLYATGGAYTMPVNSTWQLLIGSQEISGFIDAYNGGTLGGETSAEFPPFAADAAGDLAGYFITVHKNLSSYENQALKIKDDYDGVADYTGGNAANTLKVTVLFTIIDV